MKRTGPQNPNLRALIRVLKKQEAPFWKKIIDELDTPSRKRTTINLDQLERLVNDGEIVCVPGKVLGTGDINKKITVSALNYSSTAMTKIKNAGGTVLSLEELWKKYPKGSGVRIIKG